MSRVLVTPNMVRFANQSARLPMAYAPASICSPTRASILLGRQVASQTFRGNYDLDNSELTDYTSFTLDLKRAGFRLGFFGKWGVGALQGGPWNHGFHQFFGQLGNTEAHTVFPKYVTSYNSSRDQVPQTASDVNALRLSLVGNVGKLFDEKTCTLSTKSSCTYVNDVVRDEFLKFLQANADVPFFAYWAPTYPHEAKYNPNDPYSLMGAAVRHYSRLTWSNEILRGHAGQVEAHLDQDMGMFLDFMAANPTLDRNTFIVFTSDNGAHSEPKSYNPGWFMTAGGLRGYKYSMYEGGLRVPTFVRWTGQIQPGSINRVPFALYDLAATVRELVGLRPQLLYGPYIAGSSMLSTWLTGNENKAPRRNWLYAEYCYLSASKNQFCLSATYDISNWRRGQVYKLVQTEKTLELYEIISDPTESKMLKDQATINRMMGLRNVIVTS